MCKPFAVRACGIVAWLLTLLAALLIAPRQDRSQFARHPKS